MSRYLRTRLTFKIWRSDVDVGRSFFNSSKKRKNVGGGRGDFQGILKKKVAKESDNSSVFKIGEKCENLKRFSFFFFSLEKKKEKEDYGRDWRCGSRLYIKRWLVDRVGLRFRTTQNKACRLDATKDINEKWKLMTDERDFRLQNFVNISLPCFLLKSKAKKYL